MRGRHTLAAVLGVLCLLLAGCGGSAEPQPLPRPTASLSPSPSATPPVMPAAAKEKTKAGAIAFVAALRRCSSTTPGAPVTHSRTSLERRRVLQSLRCEAIADGSTASMQAGGHVQGGAWIVRRESMFYAIQRRRLAVLDVDRHVRPADRSIEPERDAKINTPAAVDARERSTCVWRTDGWQVGAMDPRRMIASRSPRVARHSSLGASRRGWLRTPAPTPGQRLHCRGTEPAASLARRKVGHGPATSSDARSGDARATSTGPTVAPGSNGEATCSAIHLPAGRTDLPALAGRTASGDSDGAWSARATVRRRLQQHRRR